MAVPMTDGSTAPDVTGGPPTSREAVEYRETAFFDRAGRLVFRAEPRGSSMGTVIFASSLFTELQRNYRREVVLSRAAAAAGFSTLRFHYRGVGNSVTGPMSPTLDTMAADLLDLMNQVDNGPLAIVGTRLGALAAGRARQERDVPLVLWEPVLDGSRWVDEVVKACLARELARGEQVTAEAVRNRWATDGTVFALGESVPAAIVDQIAATSLLDSMAGSTPALLVQMGRTASVRPAVERTHAALSERGIDAEVLSVVGHQVWWLKVGGDHFNPVEREDATSDINEGVLDWLKRTIA